MQIVKTLLSARIKILLAILFDKKAKYLLRNLAMFFVLIFMIFASYMFFYNLIFKYLIVIEDIGYLLIDRLVAIGYLIFFFLLIVSSFVFSLGSLFRSRETEYLFSTPLPVRKLFTSKFFDILIFSSWAILIMALPILYSYAKIRNFGTLEYALTGVAVLFPFVIISASIGTLLAILLKYLSKKISAKSLILISVLGFTGLLYMVIAFSKPTQLQVQFQEDFRALNLFINNFQLNSNPFLPNYWLIQSLRALVFNDYYKFFIYVSALVTTAMLSLSLLYYFVEKIYFDTWLSSIEQTKLQSVSRFSKISSKSKFFQISTSNQELALFQKDILLFFREPAQWTQLVLIMTLLALYLINLYFIPKDIEIEQWRTILFIMNFGFCGFLLATLSVRFVYPSISMEGDSFWILGSAPLSTATLFREKFISYFIAFFFLAEAIGFITSSLLNLEPLYQILTFGGILLMNISLLCLAIGLGAAFPDFSERNPGKIVSSPGGILTIIVSLIYVSFMMGILAIPTYRYTLHLVAGSNFPKNELIISVLFIFIINAVFITVPLKMGAKSFATREF